MESTGGRFCHKVAGGMDAGAGTPGKSGFSGRNRDIWGWVTIALLLIIFPAADIAFVRNSLRYRNVENWREVPAQVSLQRRDYFEERNSQLKGRSMSKSTWIDADYRYVVDGQSYHGNLVSLHGAILKRPPEGVPDHVYYNPAHPEDAVLVREPAETAWVAISLALMTALPVWLGILSWLGIRKKKRLAAHQGKRPCLHWTA